MEKEKEELGQDLTKRTICHNYCFA